MAHPEDRERRHPSSGDKASLTQLLAESCERSGLSEKDAAITQGYDPRYWPRIKAGEKAAHLERIARLPESVQQEFVKRYARQLRMDVIDRDAKVQAIAELAETAIKALKVIA